MRRVVMLRSHLLSAVVLSMASCFAAMAAMPTLRSPFPSVHMTSSAKRVTVPDLPAQHDLLGVSYYVDEKHSIADPQRKQANNAAMEPIRNFARTVSALADKSEEGAGE